MAKKAYIGINDVARKAKKMYVGVAGVARQTKKGYIGINGVARLFFENGFKVTIKHNDSGSMYYTCSITLQDGTVVPAGTRVYTLPAGSTITLRTGTNTNKRTASITLNGTVVKSGSYDISYVYTVVGEATITTSGWSSGGDNPYLGTNITITDING